MIKFLFLLLLASCTSKVPTIRSSYLLATSDDFLVSNIYVNPVKVQSKNSEVEVRYDLIIKNLKNIPRRVDLRRSIIGNQFLTIPLNCQTYEGQEKYLTIQPNSTFKVECKANLTKNFVPNGDSKLDINISLEKYAVGFKYIVRAEDFE